MKKVSLIIIIILVIAVSVLVWRFWFGGDEDTWLCDNGQWVKHGNPSAPMPESGCGENKPEEKKNSQPEEVISTFTQTGTLTKDNLGQKPEVWYFVYEEKSGSPALNAEVKFNEDARCFINGNGQLCSKIQLKEGQRVRIEGILESNVVAVERMDLLSN